MIRLLVILYLIISTLGSSVVTTYANDAKEIVRQSVKALTNASAFRMVTTYTDPQAKKLGSLTLVCVRPGAADLRYELEGQITMETIVIGHKSYIWLATAQRFKELPVDSAGIFDRMQAACLQTFNAFHSVVLVGRQALNGEPTSVYKLNGTVDGSQSNTQIWISDKSHLPLRADATASVAVKDLQNRVVQQHIATTFTYGSSLRITSPRT